MTKQPNGKYEIDLKSYKSFQRGLWLAFKYPDLSGIVEYFTLRR